MLVKVGKTQKTFDTRGISTENVLILSECVKKGTWMFIPSDAINVSHVVFNDLEYATEVAKLFSGFVLHDAELEDYEIL